MGHRNPPESGTESLIEYYPQSPATTSLDAITAIPEEHIWLASRKSPRTRQVYRHDVGHFMRTLGTRSADEFRRVDHKAVLAWEAYMREVEHAEASTIRRRLAALSSLFKHLVTHGVAASNPVRDVERPPVNRREGFTLAFSKAQARRLLDTPRSDTIAGVRDRAILGVLIYAAVRAGAVARFVSATSIPMADSGSSTSRRMAERCATSPPGKPPTAAAPTICAASRCAHVESTSPSVHARRFGQ